MKRRCIPFSTKILILLIVAAGDSLGQPARLPESKQGTMPANVDAPWSVTYHDGSGNGFRFWQETKDDCAHFEYSPITPETSSTGRYSGGDPKKGRMDGRHAGELWRRIGSLESDTSLRRDSRIKGSGAFSLKTATGTRQFIVNDGRLLREFNEFLKDFCRCGPTG